MGLSQLFLYTQDHLVAWAPDLQGGRGRVIVGLLSVGGRAECWETLICTGNPRWLRANVLQDTANAPLAPGCLRRMGLRSPSQLCLASLASPGFPISPTPSPMQGQLRLPRAPSPARNRGVKRCFPERAVRSAPLPRREASGPRRGWRRAARSSPWPRGAPGSWEPEGLALRRCPLPHLPTPTAVLIASQQRRLPPAGAFSTTSPFPVVAHLEGLVLISVISPLPAPPD